MMFGKFIDSSTVTGTQIRLDNEQWLRGRNFANSGDLNILRINSSNQIEFKQIPYVEGQGRLALYSELDGIQTSVEYLYGQLTEVTGDIATIQGDIVDIQGEIDALQEEVGDFALKDLSNLTATAIPDSVDIVSVSATSFAFKTVAKTTGNTGEVNIFSGNNTGTGTTGIVDIASGDILNVSSSSDTGIASLRSGETNGSGNTGNVNIYSGNNTGTGVSGNITISAGTTSANDATTGSVEIQSGFPFGVADSGTVSIHSHNSSKDSGDVSLYSGSASNSSGNVSISTGTASSGVTRGSIGLDGQNTTVFLTTTAASGLYSLFNVQQNSVGGSSFQVLHDAEESTNSVGIRIFNGSPTSGFSIKGWGQEAQNGGPFRFESTKAYPDDSVSTLTGGDFNILAQSTDNNNLGPFIPSRAAEISSGNVNIETANAYISGSGANANTGNINLTTGNAQGTGTRGSVLLDGRVVSADVDVFFKVTTPSAVSEVWIGNTSYGQLGGPYLYAPGLANNRTFEIGGQGLLDQNPGLTELHGAAIISSINGSYVSGEIDIYTKIQTGTNATNASYSSGDINIYSGDADVYGTGYPDANTGNVNISTGTPQGSGTRGSVNVDAYNMNVTPVAGQCFNVLSPSGQSLVAIHNQGFTIPNSPEILFNNIPQTSVATFQLYSALNNNGATFYFSGTRINANDDGSYTGGTVNMTSGGEGYITPTNASISSADFNISSANAFVSGSFTDANSGNINITTGNKEGSGTRGFISLAASYINANLAQIKNVASGSDANDAVNKGQLDLKLDVPSGTISQYIAGDGSLQTLPSSGDIPYAQSVFVAKNGSDVTGNGYVNKPFLTISAALTSITDASPTKRYAIHVAAGEYTEASIALKANVFIIGAGQKETTRITGAVSLHSSFSGGADNRSGISQAILISACDFNWNTVTSAAGKLYFNEVSFSSTINLYGHNNASAQAQFNDCIVFGAMTISGINVGVYTNCINFNNITLNQHPNGGMPTVLSMDGGYCSGTVSLITTVNDFNRRCGLFARSFWMNAVVINGSSSYADVTDSSLPAAGPTISNGGNIVYLNAGANKTLSNLSFPTAVNNPIMPATSGATNFGDWNKQWAWSFAYIHASSGSDCYMISYGPSFNPDSLGRNVGIYADGGQLQANVDGGNIDLGTAAVSGTGIRGKITLDGRVIDVTSKKIINVADPTDPQDALTLNYFNNNIPSVAALDFYPLQAYNTYATIYADNSAGVLDPVTPTNPRPGWYFKNSAGSPQKINWYFFDGAVVSCQLQNFAAFAVVTLDSIASLPYFIFYTFPTGSGDIIPSFAHSQVVYSAPYVPSAVVGTKYLIYFGAEPDVFPYLPRIELTYNAAASGGDQGATELVSTCAFSTESGASANNVQVMVENLGLNLSNFKAYFDLLILPVFQQDVIAGQYSMANGVSTFTVSGLTIGTTNYIVNVTIENVVDATVRHLTSVITAKTSTSFSFVTSQTTDHDNYKANYIITLL